MKKKTLFSLLILILLFSLVPLRPVLAQDAIVHAVLFFSPTCPHCEYVIAEVLPPLQEKYGAQLEILLIDVSSPDGQSLYQDAVIYYEIPDDRLGVPTLIVANTVMVGSGEIPDRFPTLIEQGLSAGGIDWPTLPGLSTFITSSDGKVAEAPAKLTMTDRFALDPAGNTVSVIVLIGMLVVVALVLANLKRPARSVAFPVWLVPALISLGMLVAIYLSFVELTQTSAICGPVGDCNTVQQSPYARLFGVLPVGVLGMLGYLAIFLAWVTEKLGQPAWRPKATLALWGLAGFGTLFSIYLTFLEPFVIGATCMWCITSAIVQTTLFWVSTEPVKSHLGFSKNKKTIVRRRKKTSARKRRRK